MTMNMADQEWQPCNTQPRRWSPIKCFGPSPFGHHPLFLVAKPSVFAQPLPPDCDLSETEARNSISRVDMVGISDLLDADFEESPHAINKLAASSASLSSAKDTSRAAPSKRTKKRRCVTMPKAKSKVAKSATGDTKKPVARRTAAAKRKAVEEQLEQSNEGDEEEIQETQAPVPKAGNRTHTRVTAEPEETEANMVDETMEVEPSPAVARSSHAPTRGRKAAPKPVMAEARPAQRSKTVVKQTEDVDMTSEDEDEMQVKERAVPRNTSRNQSRLGSSNNNIRRRAGSASDSERGDPNLRRKLGDITRKFENVDLRYRNLKDVGISEATANMEKLRKQCEATTQASNELVASLKKELAQQAPIVLEGRKLKKQVQTNETELAELRKANSTLSTNLSAAQNEIKNLQAKLAAARSSSAAAEAHQTKAPESALKHHVAPRTVVVNGTEAAYAAQMKEELYRDLTGLIVRSVKRSEDGDTYDCIQTGRNGSKSSQAFTRHLTDKYGSSAFQAVC